MKLAALGLALALAVVGTAASAQVGGPAKGSRGSVGGPASGSAARASVGGPTNKGTTPTGTSNTMSKKGH
jgi:hypothetical protein